MSNRFTRRVLLLDGTLNHSKPRTDGRTGTAMYGTVYANVAELAPLFAEALAKGQTEIAFDLSCWTRTRKDGSGTFFSIESTRLYQPDEAKTG